VNESTLTVTKLLPAVEESSVILQGLVEEGYVIAYLRFPVPPVTFNLAVVALVKVVSKEVDPLAGTIANAGFTTILMTLSDVAPNESVAVKDS
jgi:hypothetical protein